MGLRKRKIPLLFSRIGSILRFDEKMWSLGFSRLIHGHGIAVLFTRDGFVLELYRDKSSVQDYIQCLYWLSIYKALSYVGLVRMHQVLQHAY